MFRILLVILEDCWQLSALRQNKAYVKSTKRRRRRPGALSGAKRSYPTSEVRGSGRECQAVTAQERPRGATLRPRPGAAAGRSNPTSKEQWLCGHRRA